MPRESGQYCLYKWIFFFVVHFSQWNNQTTFIMHSLCQINISVFYLKYLRLSVCWSSRVSWRISRDANFFSRESWNILIEWVMDRRKGSLITVWNSNEKKLKENWMQKRIKRNKKKKTYHNEGKITKNKIVLHFAPPGCVIRSVPSGSFVYKSRSPPTKCQTSLPSQ